MEPVPLLHSTTRWECPNCDVTDVSPPLPPGSSRFHVCAGLHMLTAPLVAAGTRCKVEAEERQDYQGREVTHEADDGRVYMAVRTTRDDGDDVAVLAPCAQARLGSA